MLRLELISEEDHSRIFGNIQAILPLHEGMHLTMWMYIYVNTYMHACLCVCVAAYLKLKLVALACDCGCNAYISVRCYSDSTLCVWHTALI